MLRSRGLRGINGKSDRKKWRFEICWGTVGSYGSFLKYSDITFQVLNRATPRKIMVILKNTLADIVSPFMASIEAIRQ